MRFISVTLSDGKPALLNTENVAYVYPGEPGDQEEKSAVVLVGGSGRLGVKESLEEILRAGNQPTEPICEALGYFADNLIGSMESSSRRIAGLR